MHVVAQFNGRFGSTIKIGQKHLGDILGEKNETQSYRFRDFILGHLVMKCVTYTQRELVVNLNFQRQQSKWGVHIFQIEDWL
jgi:hypothetical protein